MVIRVKKKKKDYMFCYQKDTKSLFAVECGKRDFWREIRKSSTAFNIDTRRAILRAIETQDEAAMQKWAEHTDYQKFMLRTLRGLKTKTGKEKWQKKPLDKKLLAWADDLKKSLTAFQFSCYLFDEATVKTKDGKTKKGPRRKLVGCHLNGLVMLDIDHVDNPMEVWEKLQANEKLMERVVLVHITSSGHGIRIIFTADIKTGNLADNQIAFAADLGYSPDQSCIDATRNSFAPKENEILFIDEEKLFNYYDETFDRRFTAEYRQKNTQPTRFQFDADNIAAGGGSPVVAHTTPEAGEQGTLAVGGVDVEPVAKIKTTTDNIKTTTETTIKDDNLSSHEKMFSPCERPEVERSKLSELSLEEKKELWRGYDIQSIIDARYADKLPCGEDSNRHKESLKLATDLLIMLDGDRQRVLRIVEAQPWVKDIIEERDENVEQTVESAAGCVAEKEKKYANPMPSKAMLEAVKAVTGKNYREIVSEELRVKSEAFATAKSEQAINSMLDGWGAEIEAMFDDFPLLADVCAGLKRSQYPAAVFTAGGALMTLMTRCTYRFYHRPERERRLNCSLLIIGHPASNKSMADDICDILMSPVETADKAGLAALNRYKQDTKKRAANKEGKDRPQGIIRIHPARTSNGQLIQDMLNAKEVVDGKEMQLHMFTFDTELDNSITLQSGGSWINKQSMELKAFHNEEDGQMYQNSDSPVDKFHVTWNYIYTGTPIALKKKVNERNFGSGLSTRLTVIPMPKTNYEMIAFQEVTTIDWQRLERMKTWAFKLDSRAGELPLWPLVKRIYEWVKNRMADCAEDDSEANELMLKRVPYHALNYSAPFIDMRHYGSLHQEGKFWEGTYEVDETDWKLCELMARIQYATQQHFFGVLAEKYFDDMNNDVQITGRRHQQKSVDGYNRLPETFSKEDVMKCFGYNNDNSTTSKIKRLIDAGMAVKSEEYVEDGHIRKKYRKVSQMCM